MTRQAVAVLRDAGVHESRLMVVARDDARPEDLPAAGIDRTDGIPGLLRGLAAGGIVGTLGGVAMLIFGGLSFALGIASLVLFALAGAALSGLAGFLTGASIRSSRLKPFEHAIEHDGKILLLLGIQRGRDEDLRGFVEEQVPGIECLGFEPRAPLIP